MKQSSWEIVPELQGFKVPEFQGSKVPGSLVILKGSNMNSPGRDLLENITFTG